MANQSPTIGAGASCNFFLVAVLLSFLLLPQHDLFSNDTWWHVALGDQIKALQGIPAESFSHTALGQPIFCHWWLSDVIFSSIATVFGLSALEAFGFLLVIILLVSVARLSRDLGAATRYAVAAEVLFFFTAQRFLILRPQLFTALLLTWILRLYIRSRERGFSRFWVVPFIFVLWANLHGGFLLGLLLLLGLCLFEMSECVVTKTGSDRALVLAAVFLGSVLASLLNPYGTAAFSNALQHDPFVQGANQHIDEWLAPTLSQAPWLYLSIIFAIVLVASRRCAATAFEAALFFLATVAAVMSWRHSLLFGLFAVPVISVWTTRVAQDKFPCRDAIFRLPSAVLGAVAVLSILSWQLCYRQPVLASPRLAELFPVQAADWILQHPQSGNLFNNYEWGGYLVYAFRGHPAVYIDSRLAPFLGIFPDEYYTILNLEPGWKEAMQRRSISWALLPTYSKTREQLESKQGWSKLYGDEIATVLRAP